MTLTGLHKFWIVAQSLGINRRPYSERLRAAVDDGEIASQAVRDGGRVVLYIDAGQAAAWAARNRAQRKDVGTRVVKLRKREAAGTVIDTRTRNGKREVYVQFDGEDTPVWMQAASVLCARNE